VVGLSDDPARRILSTHLHADGRDAEILYLDKPGWQTRPRVSREDVEQGRLLPTMEGPRVYKHAVSRMPEVVHEALAANGLSIDALDMLIPHQANLRINEAVVRALGLPPDRCHNNIQKYGNTTSATIPICLKEAVDLGKIQPGDLVCLAAFGAGLTWGSVLLRY
jgi:3-oxoacyl-[acyl-carrier-protein] synthase-3